MTWILLLTVHIGSYSIQVKLDHFRTEEACEQAQAYFEQWVLSEYETTLSCEKLSKS